jgi:aldehyde dehydrogenase (NAD+)
MLPVMLEQAREEARQSGGTDVAKTVERLRRTFRSGRTKSMRWRAEQLRALRSMVVEREKDFIDALAADMSKPLFEAWIGETAFIRQEVDYAIKHLRAWTKPERVKTPIPNQPGRSFVVREPLGVVLIIGPWNYPVQLVLSPLIGAIAAGNAALIKPSEIAPHASAAIAEWVPRYIDTDAVAVVEGGVAETTALLEQRFDHIFYTGGGAVGRVVMTAAAKHLTPVTLELGGKSPCYVDRDADLEVAARRIVWGKFFNAGQTCVAPDYVLVDEAVEAQLVERLQRTVREFYGEDPQRSPDYARIVSDRHFQRLLPLVKDGEVVTGGQSDATSRYIAPTILRGVKDDAKVMQDEIFGPILPVQTVHDVEEAIDRINARPKPLALYVFTRSKEVKRRVLESTSSGGACVNDTVAHLSVPELPFGGVGPSGMGAYHGRASFETFSHRKSVLDKATVLDPPLRYPPYTAEKLKWAKRLV